MPTVYQGTHKYNISQEVHCLSERSCVQDSSHGSDCCMVTLCCKEADECHISVWTAASSSSATGHLGHILLELQDCAHSRLSKVCPALNAMQCNELHFRNHIAWMHVSTVKMVVKEVIYII